MTVTRTLIGGLVLTSVVLLAGCSGVSGEGSDGSFAEISGTPVSLESELTALCAEIVEQALPVDVALVLAESNGYVASVAGDAGAETTAAEGEASMVLSTSGDIVVGCEAQG